MLYELPADTTPAEMAQASFQWAVSALLARGSFMVTAVPEELEGMLNAVSAALVFTGRTNQYTVTTRLSTGDSSSEKYAAELNTWGPTTEIHVDYKY